MTSVAESALCLAAALLWDVLQDLDLWLPCEADIRWLEDALSEVAVRLAAALVAEAIADRTDFAA